ncbi:hypothetical protein B0H19DRAFT_845640, partial [Mycena capillaripes]
RLDTGVKDPVGLAETGATVTALLDTIQREIFSRARATYDSCLKEVKHCNDIVPTLDNKCVAVIPWCETQKCEEDIKERSGRAYVFIRAEPYRAPSAGAKSLAIPFDQ